MDPPVKPAGDSGKTDDDGHLPLRARVARAAVVLRRGRPPRQARAPSRSAQGAAGDAGAVARPFGLIASYPLIPAQAGIQGLLAQTVLRSSWVAAFAGTSGRRGSIP